MRFTIGQAVVDVIVDDGDYELPLSGFLPGLDLERLARHQAMLEPEFLDFARDRLKVAIQSYVVKMGGRTILIDSCIGDDRDRPEVPVWQQRHDSGFLERLQQAGTDPAAVDLVFCTHLHVDQVGWNTRLGDGRFLPTFPNARYLFGRDELADWMTQRQAGTIPGAPRRRARGQRHPDPGSRPRRPGRDRARARPRPHAHPASRPHPRPDGRPGRAPAGRALFCGDAIHSPVQVCQPDDSTAVDVDPSAAIVTRRALLDEATETGRLVIPAHFRGRRCAHIRRAGNGFEPVFRRGAA